MLDIITEGVCILCAHIPPAGSEKTWRKKVKLEWPKKRTHQRRTWNNLSQYYKTQNAYFHILLTDIQYETLRSTVPLNPWTVIIYSDLRGCVCIYHSFLLHTSPIKKNQQQQQQTNKQTKNPTAWKENSLPNISITINLGRLTGIYIIWNGRDQSQEHSPFTPPKKPPSSKCKVKKL